MISGLGKLADPDAMRLVHMRLRDPELREEVQAAVVELADDLSRVRSADTRKAALRILDDVIPGLENEKLARRAEKAARKLRLSVAEEV